MSALSASAPGRICLFGEHQDYLGLPVIALGIDLCIELTARRREDARFTLAMPDTGTRDELDAAAGRDLPYRHGRDYLPAALNVLRRRGLRWGHGYDVTVRGGIPINAGASSSSALQVAWTALLLAAAGDARAGDAEFIARIAYESEVPEFGAPGGMMDHYATAVGGMIYLECGEPSRLTRLPPRDWAFVLIDSGTPKDTNALLGRVRGGTEAALGELARRKGVERLAIGELAPEVADALPDTPEATLLRANLVNRAITQRALALLRSPATEPAAVGRLLADHHAQLSAHLGISTPLIDDLLIDAGRAGALGGKINGSGGGGSCFAICPGTAAAEAIARQFAARGLRAWAIRPAAGVSVERG